MSVLRVASVPPPIQIHESLKTDVSFLLSLYLGRWLILNMADVWQLYGGGGGGGDKILPK